MKKLYRNRTFYPRFVWDNYALKSELVNDEIGDRLLLIYFPNCWKRILRRASSTPEKERKFFRKGLRKPKICDCYKRGGKYKWSYYATADCHLPREHHHSQFKPLIEYFCVLLITEKGNYLVKRDFLNKKEAIKHGKKMVNRKTVTYGRILDFEIIPFKY